MYGNVVPEQASLNELKGLLNQSIHRMTEIEKELVAIKERVRVAAISTQQNSPPVIDKKDSNLTGGNSNIITINTGQTNDSLVLFNELTETLNLLIKSLSSLEQADYNNAYYIILNLTNHLQIFNTNLNSTMETNYKNTAKDITEINTVVQKAVKTGTNIVIIVIVITIIILGTLILFGNKITSGF